MAILTIEHAVIFFVKTWTKKITEVTALIFNTLTQESVRRDEFVEIKLRIPRRVLEQMIQDVSNRSWIFFFIVDRLFLGPAKNLKGDGYRLLLIANPYLNPSPGLFISAGWSELKSSPNIRRIDQQHSIDNQWILKTGKHVNKGIWNNANIHIYPKPPKCILSFRIPHSLRKLRDVATRNGIMDSGTKKRKQCA